MYSGGGVGTYTHTGVGVGGKEVGEKGETVLPSYMPWLTTYCVIVRFLQL